MAWAQKTEPASAGHAVASEHRYFRMIALVPLAGSGKEGDPIRPEFVPSGPPKAAAAVLSDAARAKPGALRPGILSWSMQFTDDKKMAIVHLVAVDPAAFDDLRHDKRPDLRVFEIGKQDKKTIESELRKYRKDFDLEKFRVVAQ